MNLGFMISIPGQPDATPSSLAIWLAIRAEWGADLAQRRARIAADDERWNPCTLRSPRRKRAHVVCGGQRLPNNRRNAVDVDIGLRAS